MIIPSTVFTNGGSVFETYSAKNLIPFASHDGAAVVTLNQGQPIFFDKSITITSNSPNFSHFEATFHVTNATSFSWADYEFLLVNPPDNLRFSTPNSGDSDLKGFTPITSNNKLVEIEFFSQNAGQNILPTTGTNFHLGFNFDVPTNGSLTFELRQIATAVPVPPTAFLMASGLLGLLGLGWRRQ